MALPGGNLIKIRSITYFTDIHPPFDDIQIEPAGRFLVRARQAFTDAGYQVQTTRLALPPFAQIIGNDANDAIRLAQAVEAACSIYNIDFAAIGPARLQDSPAHYRIIPDVIRETGSIFTAAEIANVEHGIDLRAIKLVAGVMRQNSTITGDGLGNTRFTALANVPAGMPFFPAAYYSSAAAGFALAIEGANLAVTAFDKARSLAEARQLLQTQIEQVAEELTRIANGLDEHFTGIDFSLAPFPSEAVSIGVALEALGVPRVGLNGTLAAAAFTIEAVQRAKAPHVGFSGLFMPVLEDPRLAQRSSEGVLTVNDLLLYAAVCGTGLDTVPLPGDISSAALAAILLDVAALALRLDKPLTARLMPMPGKVAGDALEFDFPYFVNGHVLAHKAQPLTNLLNGVESFKLGSYSSR